MRTNEKTCIITGLKVDVMIINQEFVSNSLTPQFDAVQVTNKQILIVNKNKNKLKIFSFLQFSNQLFL